VRLTGEQIREALLPARDSEGLEAHGSTEAAVLIPIFGLPDRPGIVFTKRREDMRRHAGEISFPGGRRDTLDEPLVDVALREAREEIGLDPAAVELVGTLPPIGTFVTNYKVFPFVGLIPEGLAFELSPLEVASVLEFRVDDLLAGYGRRRLVRRGVPIKMDTYEVAGELVWGATARILADLLRRLGVH